MRHADVPSGGEEIFHVARVKTAVWNPVGDVVPRHVGVRDKGVSLEAPRIPFIGVVHVNFPTAGQAGIVKGSCIEQIFHRQDDVTQQAMLKITALLLVQL